MKLKPHEHDVVVKRPRHPQATYYAIDVARDTKRLIRRIIIGMIVGAITGGIAGFLAMHFLGTAS